MIVVSPVCMLSNISFVVIAVHQTGKEGNWGNKKSVVSVEDDKWNTQHISKQVNLNTTIAKTVFLSNHKLSTI